MDDERKKTPKANGSEWIFMPGEMEWGRYDAAHQSGQIQLTDAMVENRSKRSTMFWLEQITTE